MMQGGPLARLVEFALAQRLLVSVLTLLAAGAGAISLLNLPIDAFPDVSSTQVKIIMKAPGMTPESAQHLRCPWENGSPDPPGGQETKIKII